jgi:hypothetical protein
MSLSSKPCIANLLTYEPPTAPSGVKRSYQKAAYPDDDILLTICAFCVLAVKAVRQIFLGKFSQVLCQEK